MNLGAPQRNPGGEGGVELLDRGECAPGQDMVSDDGDLALNPALGLRRRLHPMATISTDAFG
ncbi:hypothetical protein [Nonomuraea sp. NPDC049400]|uniref:hypothetical protein n=1 Tax=Nonomuraea sp. NPDC049400 TaxID=3364352 RepID=UPI00378E42AD